MKLRTFAVLGLALLATAGCRSDPAIPLLERQLRLQEDEIYRLRGQLENMCDDAKVVEDRAEGSSRSHAADEPNKKRFRRNSSSNGSETPSVNVELPGTPSSGVPKELLPRGGSLPPDIPEVPKELQGPSKSPGPEDNGTGRAAPDSLQDGPSIEMGRRGRPRMTMTAAASADSGEAFAPQGDSQHVSAIVLNRSLTGGINDGGSDGDQGLLVVVEPRDSRGRAIDAPAKIMVALLDPAVLDEEGNASRLALWEFTETETASLFRRVGKSEGIHLAMAWPDDPPKHSKLHLFVRYVTSDDRMLQANHPIEVSLQGDRTARSNRGDVPFAEKIQAEPRRERVPVAEAFRPDDWSSERKSDRSPHTAARDRESDPQRPVWSPERR